MRYGARPVGAHAQEVAAHQRFEFGENWRRFSSSVDDERIAEACNSLRAMLDTDTLEGLTFLDIGCGSGLFSLAAAQLQAARVYSLDFDPLSVACTEELRRRFSPHSEHWVVEQASVLDRAHIQSLGSFDVVYSWGVLHHTGDMWSALDTAALPVAVGGRLFISIYNDQGLRSRIWRTVKRLYNRLPAAMRAPYVAVAMAPQELMIAGGHILRRRPLDYLKTWSEYKRRRGMSRWHDLVDWVGGYPFEVASPEEIFDFYKERGFTLERLKTCGGGLGCNQFVFLRAGDAAATSGGSRFPRMPAAWRRA
jgi:2-polyprenyl-3-methyl-5-hydroxy-6-metoxy-1,4-benzoquinol methylase